MSDERRNSLESTWDTIKYGVIGLAVMAVILWLAGTVVVGFFGILSDLFG